MIYIKKKYDYLIILVDYLGATLIHTESVSWLHEVDPDPAKWSGSVWIRSRDTGWLASYCHQSTLFTSVLKRKRIYLLQLNHKNKNSICCLRSYIIPFFFFAFIYFSISRFLNFTISVFLNFPISRFLDFCILLLLDFCISLLSSLRWILTLHSPTVSWQCHLQWGSCWPLRSSFKGDGLAQQLVHAVLQAPKVLLKEGSYFQINKILLYIFSLFFPKSS